MLPEQWKNTKDEVVLKASLEDPRLFRILLERYESAFLRKAYGVVRGWEDSADVVQETFIRIYKYAKTFSKREGVEFKSWAYKILMNTALTHYAKLRRSWGNVEYSDEIASSVSGSDDRFFERLELTDSVNLALAEMPVGLATVIRAHYLEGKSYKDISKELSITSTTLKMRLFRARQAFRTHFKNISDPRYEPKLARSRSDDER
jgi:RNA polymerase sigma factor (sigma-70 family)